ncbi:MAG TPA: hypothetical protein VFG22_15185 [Polyangiales bacterium]|nr:hypothetical protein [Polyangiales bacterium]
MSQVLTVPTHFNDIGELSEGFLDRVERDTLILYGPVAYEDGSEIEFVVLLADGSPALEGAGRVRAAVDGGADRVPETRYDVVVEALVLDGRYEVVFERLVLARQAVSDRPLASDDEPVTNEMDSADESDAPDVDDVELTAEEVFSLAPGEIEVETIPPEAAAVDTVPPDAFEDEDEPEYEAATVIAAVDAEAMMAEAEAAAESVSVSASAAVSEPAPVSASAPEPVYDSEPQLEAQSETDLDEEAFGNNEDGETRFDSEYAFEHGIAMAPQVGMPVPVPSMAAPPGAPPEPPRLRLAEPPKGLTRPSLALVEESSFTTDGEVSDVHSTGLFAYEDGLPVPARPPLPDPNRQRAKPSVEAHPDYDVEDSEPPNAQDDEYEEIRLSDFAEAAEEG